MDWETGVHTKDSKNGTWYLLAYNCLTHYKLRNNGKVEQSRKWCSTLPYTSVKRELSGHPWLWSPTTFTASLNVEFSFFLTGCLTKAKETNLLDYSFMLGVSLVWFGLVLWHINPCRLFNAKSIFIQIISSISNNSV